MQKEKIKHRFEVSYLHNNSTHYTVPITAEQCFIRDGSLVFLTEERIIAAFKQWFWVKEMTKREEIPPSEFAQEQVARLKNSPLLKKHGS